MTYSSQPSSSSEPVCLPCQVMAPDFDHHTEAMKMSDYPTQEPPAQMKTQTAAREERPTFDPPTLRGAANQNYTAWQTDKKVLGLWRNSATRNAYMYVDQVGWRKFADNSDYAVGAFNVIAAHAKTLGKPVQFFEESDNKVSTLYVW